MATSPMLKILVLAAVTAALTAGAAESSSKAGAKHAAAKKVQAETASKVASGPTHRPLSDAELTVAASVYVGELPCELGQKVSLHPDEKNPGYFTLALKPYRFHMHPVATTTGAVRLEDPEKGAVWIQVANKSMLMSQKEGRRLADECASPVQQAAADAMKTNPPPSLLDMAQNQR